MAKFARVAIFVVLFMAGACNQRPSLDELALDAALNTAMSAKTLEICSLERTNALTGPDATRVVNLLQRTNRVPVSAWNKREVAGWIAATQGTNQAFIVSVFEGGVLSHDNYTFKLRTSSGISLSP